ncbi:MAG: PEP-CTERM system histidine kinase PrsK [Nitrospirae bacterium]|nr:PEP-CTERM system histidine kinase PrsK [Candidatus Manganitrophaceae bacterium]
MEELFNGMVMKSGLPTEVLYWRRWELTAVAPLSAVWLLFSVSFGRSNYKELIAKWKWVAIAFLLFPLSMVTIFIDAFFILPDPLEESAILVMPLGWSGYAFYLFDLVSSVVILMNLEETLRATAGNKRWQIKFMILGVGGLFALEVYTASQTLLFSSIRWGMGPINSFAVLVANVFIIFSLMRNRFLDVDLYFSRTFLSNSITVAVVGVYLLAVGILAKAIGFFGENGAVPVGMFFVFLSLLALSALLLSDHLRQEFKRFISRNFYRSRYDYRKEWMAFTRQTTSLVEVRDLCSVVTKKVAETLGTPSVTIWLIDEGTDLVSLGGSTLFSDSNILGLSNAGKVWGALLAMARENPVPFDFASPTLAAAKQLKESYSDYFDEARIDHCVPLIAGKQLLGVMTLGPRVMKEAFLVEDYDLLKTIADQTAGSLLNLKLAQHLMKAKEMEAFQTLSAFFIHDLKNVASMLSLTMRNLPAHFDNPEFRSDTLRVISQSVGKMNDMCSRLSLLTRKLELQPAEVDLNELTTAILSEMNGSIRSMLIRNFRTVPKCSVDSDQIRKVIVNLVLNANDAVSQQGTIRVETDQVDECVVLSVTDNGCGIPKEFIERALFQPFQTTKSEGLGIGLFHSKKIVEAHHGRIQVESEEGVGTTFRVILPIHQSGQVNGRKYEV